MCSPGPVFHTWDPSSTLGLEDGHSDCGPVAECAHLGLHNLVNRLVFPPNLQPGGLRSQPPSCIGPLRPHIGGSFRVSTIPPKPKPDHGRSLKLVLGFG